MFTPIEDLTARVPRRGLCAAVALALSLAFVVLAVAASTTPMTGMTGMVDTVAASTSSTPVASAETAASASADGPLTMGAMCDTVCLTDVIGLCAAAAGLILITLMALLLASRRDTFMGLLARTRPRALARRRRVHPPWTVLSPISLCVLRV